MTRFEFSEATSEDIAGLKSKYLSRLSAPLDGMWEAFAGMATPWLFTHDGEAVGYAAVNGDRQLLQFFLQSEFDAKELFARLIQEQEIKGAIVPTCDPLTLALALDHQKSVTANAIMYHMPAGQKPAPAALPADSDFNLITEETLDQAVGFAHKTLGASEDWLQRYFGNLTARQELFGLWQNGSIIATGECRVSDSQQGIADVGMVVGKSHRRGGVATNILRALAGHAQSKGLTSICSTETGNIGAQKAISRAGFVSRHRILEITF